MKYEDLTVKLFKIIIMLSLKLLYSPVRISQSCCLLMQRRLPVAFVSIRTVCLAASRSVPPLHTPVRLSHVPWTNTSDQSLIRRGGLVRWFGAIPASSEEIINVFDRNAKRKQKNRTADLPDYNVYDYIKDEVCSSLYKCDM